MPEPDLAWTSWPLRDDAPRSYFLTLLPVVVVVLSFLAFGSLGFVAIPVLLLSLARFFLPTRFALDADGIRSTFCGMTRRLPWSRFRRFYPHSIGVHLSTFEQPSPLDPFRGFFLRFRDNRDAVLARLERAGLRKGERKIAAGDKAPRQI